MSHFANTLATLIHYRGILLPGVSLVDVLRRPPINYNIGAAKVHLTYQCKNSTLYIIEEPAKVHLDLSGSKVRAQLCAGSEHTNVAVPTQRVSVRRGAVDCTDLPTAAIQLLGTSTQRNIKLT